MGERKGFDPLRRLPAYTLSRRAPSTTRPSLRAQAAPAANRRLAFAARRGARGGTPFKGAGNILIAAFTARPGSGGTRGLVRERIDMQKGLQMSMLGRLPAGTRAPELVGCGFSSG